MASLNKVIIIGRLGQDPERRYTPNGSTVTSFSVATDEVWMDKNSQKQTRTEWHRIVVWGKQAETSATYLAKGRTVYVEGSIRSRTYKDKSGADRTAYEIVAQRVLFLESKDGGSRPPAQKRNEDDYAHPASPDYESDAPPISDDDIPF